ncbi:ABC transporter permease [Nocardioides hungaricus]
MTVVVASGGRRRPDRASRRLSPIVVYLVRRLLLSVLTLFVSTFLVFSALYITPGGPISALSKGRTLSPELIAQLEQQYHLDDPFLERYWSWLTDALHGNLGTSLMYQDSVGTIIGQRVGVTFTLIAYSSLLIVLFGVGTGVVAGLRRGAVDGAILALTSFLVAVPGYVSALVLLDLFAIQLGWFPTLGAGQGFVDQIWHLTLPSVALALASLALVSRVTRAAVRAEVDHEHVQTAVSRGIPYRTVVRRHVFRNATIPVTTVVGITVPTLLAITAIVEQAFSLNGLGSALVQAASYNDFPVVQGISLIYVLAFVTANTLVDVFYGLLDPRIRVGSAR